MKKKSPSDQQPNNPLHGVKLLDILEFLVDKHGWEELGAQIKIRCFNNDPSINSCLLYTSPSPRDRTRSRMPSSA